MFRTASAATLALLLSSTSAFALEGKALLEKLINESGSKITYGSVEETASDGVVLRDVSMTGKGAVTTMTVLTLEGLREAGDRVELDRSSGENMETRFSVTRTVDGKPKEIDVAMRIASGTSDKVVAPAGAILAATPEELLKLSGRMEIGSYVLEGITADFDGDGTFETSMAKVALADLSSPLQFRYDAASVGNAKGPAPEPLTLGSLLIEGTKVSGGAGEFTLEAVNLSGLNLPATLDAEPQSWMTLYDAFSMGPMAFAAGANPLLKVDSVSVDVRRREGSVVESTSTVEGIFVDAAALAGPNAGALQAVGYDTFTGRMEGVGRYDYAKGTVALNKLLLDIDEVAELDMTYRMTGYTLDFARQLNELSLQANAGAGQPDPMAMMQLVSQLKLEEATIALKDDSLTQRLLKFQAGQMNTTAEQLAAGAPMFIGFGMAQLGMPDFTAQVSTALGTFLKDPGTLTISAKPAQPVSFGDLMVAAQQAPKALVQMMNVAVDASK